MEPFKNLINPGTVAQAGQHLQRVWPGFDRARFEQQAAHGLDALEFKARAMQLADALQATLPPRFADAAEVLEASLAPPVPLDAAGEPAGLSAAQSTQGLAGWVVWSMGEFVARQGMADVPRALACLHALTQRFSAEFAIRPFVRDHPALVWDTLTRWTQDPSAYVRRSVANHLNDIAKDHADLVAGWVQQHRTGADARRTALLRHASRSLIKQGHAPTLVAWGLQPGLQGSAQLALSAAHAAVGDGIDLAATLTSTARVPQDLVVDYVVHHVRANGGTSPKVFKGWKLTLAPGETRPLAKRHSLRPVTTRTLYPGTHRVELLVNGCAVAAAAFELRA